MPNREEGFSIHGPFNATKFIPSLYLQLIRLAGNGGAKPDCSFIAITNYRTLQTIGGQTPIAPGIDLRRLRAFAGPDVKAERLRFITLKIAVHADRRWQWRTLHVPDSDVLKNQTRRSTGHWNGKNGT